MATTKAIKDWTLDDFLNEMNESMTIEKGKLFSTQKYKDANESDRHYMIWTDAEKPVYEKFGQLLIDNTIETNGQFSFGQCRVEPNTHEMKNPRLYCNGYYYILTKFGSYNDWLHDAVKNYEERKVKSIMDSISVGDIIYKKYGYENGKELWRYEEVLKKNKRDIVTKMLSITEVKDIVEKEVPWKKASWVDNKYVTVETTRTEYYTHEIVECGKYKKFFDEEMNLFKTKVTYNSVFNIAKSGRFENLVRVESDKLIEEYRQKAAC